MSEAGAEATALMSPGKYALKFRTQEEEEDVLKMVGRHLREMDVVLIEGFTWVEMPKVEVFREGISEKIMTDKQQRIALYGDSSEESESGFYSWSDLSGLADCILASVPDFPV